MLMSLFWDYCRLLAITFIWISQLSPTLWQHMRLVRHMNVPSPLPPVPRGFGYSSGPMRGTAGKASRSHMLHMTVREHVTPWLMDFASCYGWMYAHLISHTKKLFMDFICFRGLPRIDRRHSERWKIIRFRESPGNSKGMQFLPVIILTCSSTFFLFIRTWLLLASNFVKDKEMCRNEITGAKAPPVGISHKYVTVS